MGVMLTEYLLVELHHFHASDYETAVFDSRDYLTDKSTLYGRGLQYDESLLHLMLIILLVF